MQGILRDSPVLVRKGAKKGTSIASVCYRDYCLPAIIINKKSNNNGIVVSRYILRELRCDEEDLIINEYEDGLFVYGTLLPRYITPDGIIGRGWGGLTNFLWLKTIVRKFKLVYNYLPYAIPSTKGYVLGVTYFGVPQHTEQWIDNIELGAGYKKISISGTIVENFPWKIRVKIRMYAYEGAQGVKLPTMLFGEIFFVDSKAYWYRQRKSFDVLRGNSPIIITAPHGGLYRPTNRVRNNRNADENTYDIAKLVAEKIYELTGRRIVPNVVLAKIHRSIIDFNREPKGNTEAIKYHKTIQRLARRKDKVLLVDIHGMMDRPNREVELGTFYGKTVHGHMGIAEEIKRVLTKHGIKVAIDKELVGHYTVLEHSNNKNVYAIQIEICRSLRYRQHIDRIATILAKGIINAYKTLQNQ